MRKIIPVFFILMLSATAKAQDIDSFLSVSQTLELAISTPQPRLNQNFQITLDINYLRAHIFKSAIGKIQMTDQVKDNDLMILGVNAVQKGKMEIGPLNFTINGTAYTTNKITYEVIDPLPDIDEGLWFRKVMTGENTFCIIIEQRIPAEKVKTVTSENSYTITTVPETDEYVRLKNSYSIKGLSGSNSHSRSDFGSFYDAEGNRKEFMNNYTVYYFTIQDKTIKIKMTKAVFENLPDDYIFEDIIIQ